MATILRDDSALRSLSSNERTFVRNCATATRTSGTSTREDRSGGSSATSAAVLRIDGRHPGEIRSIRLTFGRTTTGRSECTVQLGLTRVGCIVTCDLIPPQSRPNDGSIKFSVDLSPMAMMGFSSSLDYDEGKKHMANRIARVIEKTIVDGGAIDVESLCVVGGTWVWRINVDITALDHGGNLVDASMLAAIAALRHFRKPEVMVSSSSATTSGTSSSATTTGNARGAPIILSSDDAEPTPLPLHHTPVCVTFGLFGDPTGASSLVAALIDPSDREELIMDGLITYAFNKYGELCCLDFPGGCELRYSQLIQCATLAEQKAVELCKMLEEALEAAEGKAWAERMERLSKRSSASSSVVVDMLSHRTRGEEEKGLFAIPQLDDDVAQPLEAFITTTASSSQVVHVMEEEPMYVTDTTTNYLALVEEEEKYRLQALDYSLGHVAVKVKEQIDKDGGVSSRIHGSKEAASGSSLGGTLIQSMIRAARSISKENTYDTNTRIESTLDTIIDRPIPSCSDDQNQNLATSLLHNTSTYDDDASRSKNSNDARRIRDAEEEFDTYAKMATPKTDDDTMLVDDDEDVTVLQSEFATLVPVAQVKNKSVASEGVTGTSTAEGDDDEVDLFMAIKRKGKSSKGKKKK
jgi:exosome complex component RRP45